MKLGVRYCGGCNPRYDRAAVVKNLASLPGVELTYDTSEYCDIWVLACGCAAACQEQGDILGGEILRFSTSKEYYQLKSRLKKELEEGPKEAVKKVCRVGDQAQMERTFTMEDVRQFAGLTGDLNGLHVDPAVASKGIFRRPVVHGVLVGSLISSVMGTKLPGNGTIFQKEEIEYLNPVYPGETVTATVTLTDVKEESRYYIGTLEGVCTNQDGVEVCRATCTQMMLKRFFEIEA